MKLRNKKTGEVFDALIREKGGGGSYSLIVYDIKAYESKRTLVDTTHYILDEYDSLAELNEEWEGYKPAEKKPRRYRLIKDLPTFNKGDEFYIAQTGALWHDGGGDDDVCAYAAGTLIKFPNILEDWFEPIDEAKVEPLIEDEKIRKAVRAWAEANEIVKAFVVMNEQLNWSVYGDDIDRNRFSIEFFSRVVSAGNEVVQYTITELCGEEDE